MDVKNARGTRDVSGPDAVLKQHLVKTIREVFEVYGYNPLETPAIEKYDFITSKYAGGEEILKEIFRLKDQGGRDLALRYDHTVPLARFIACNYNLKMPFKRYSIGSVYRDGPLKLGRYREFTQSDADVVGDPSVKADAESVKIILDLFRKLGFEIVVKVNSRKILNRIVKDSGINDEMCEDVILAVDKLEKIGLKGVRSELREKGVSEESVKKLEGFLSAGGSNREKIELLKSRLGGCVDEIQELLDFVRDDSVVFEPSLARGLAYYTGCVFEAFLKGSEIKSSVAAGGRYDKMIGNFLNNGRDYPAVGVSFGIDVIIDAMKASGREFKKSVVKFFAVSIGENSRVVRIVEDLRGKGISADFDLSGKPGKAMSYANSYSIPFVILVGKKEAEAESIKIRDMKTGEEKIFKTDEFLSERCSEF